MNTLKVLICLLCFSVLTAHAKDSKQRVESTAVETTSQVSKIQSEPVRKPARKTHQAKGAATDISALPGTVATLCCGSLDPHSMTGDNCAYMHTGQGCGGNILACPQGSSETVKQDGSGYCKDDG